MPGNSQPLHGDIYDDRRGVSIDDRRIRAEVVDRLVDAALEYGEDFAQKLIVMLGDLDDYYPYEFAEHQRRLRHGLKGLVKSVHEPVRTEQINGDKYVLESGATQYQIKKLQQL